MKRSGSLPTATDGHPTFQFDGVFREVNNKDTREKLYAAQKCISGNDWSKAKTMISELIEETEDDHDLRNVKLILQEIELYQKRQIDASVQPAIKVDLAEVRQRRPEMYFENFKELPQSIFVLKNGTGSEQVTFVGRRILSHQWIANKIRELHCSLITASMLFGVMVDHRIQEDGIIIYYRPLLPAEKKFIMHDIVERNLKQTELVFPYPALQHINKEEIHCPDEGWEIDENLALQLGEGEVYLRDYSVQFLKSLGTEELRLYDPACSTGQFLYTMKSALPNSYTIGQDLSRFMVQYAVKRVDEIHVGNAIEPKIADDSADVMFVRFINSEVLKAVDARSMIKPLLRSIKKGGYMVIFGHTPVLVSNADLEMQAEVKIIQSVGGDKKYDGVFQYYVCKKY